MDALKELLDQQNYYEDLLRRQEMAFCSFSQMDQQEWPPVWKSYNEIDELKKHHTAQQIV